MVETSKLIDVEKEYQEKVLNFVDRLYRVDENGKASVDEFLLLFENYFNNDKIVDELTTKDIDMILLFNMEVFAKTEDGTKRYLGLTRKEKH